jgi:hypothetical protein
MALRTVGVRLTAEIGDFQSKLKAAGQSTRDFKGELDKAARRATSTLSPLRPAPRYRPARPGRRRGEVARRLRQGDVRVSAATHAPQAELDQLRAAALQAGKDTAVLAPPRPPTASPSCPRPASPPPTSSTAA